MLNKVTFSQKDQNSYVSQGLKVVGLAAIGAGTGLVYSALSKDKFNKEKENILTKHFNEIEEEVQDYVEYRKRSGGPLWPEEIDNLRKEYISDKYYKEKLNEALDKLKNKVTKHKKLSVGIGLIAGSLIGTIWVLVNKRKNNREIDINANNATTGKQSSKKLTVLSQNTSDINKEDNNKSIKNMISVVKSSLAGTATGILYYLGFNQTKLNKEKNAILAKYDEIIEKQIKKRIDSALEIDNEVLSEQDIASARIRMRKRQQNKIDAELTPLKNRAKQCFKKNTGIGLLVGTALGGAYILFKKYNKKEI